MIYPMQLEIFYALNRRKHLKEVISLKLRLKCVEVNEERFFFANQ